jgi:hypothetical protein
MTAVDELGYLAASLVLATFCAKSMVRLRMLAIASNITFVAYGYFVSRIAPIDGVAVTLFDGLPASASRWL